MEWRKSLDKVSRSKHTKGRSESNTEGINHQTDKMMAAGKAYIDSLMKGGTVLCLKKIMMELN